MKQSELGIGQPALALYRYKLVDYLPIMYQGHEFITGSKKPGEIASYDTIIYPFDTHIWIFTITCMVLEFVNLIIIQNIWSVVSGHANPKDYLFEGDIPKY